MLYLLPGVSISVTGHQKLCNWALNVSFWKLKKTIHNDESDIACLLWLFIYFPCWNQLLLLLHGAWLLTVHWQSHDALAESTCQTLCSWLVRQSEPQFTMLRWRSQWMMRSAMNGIVHRSNPNKTLYSAVYNGQIWEWY